MLIPLMTSGIHFVNICSNQAFNISSFIKLLSFNISTQVAIDFNFLFANKPLQCLKCRSLPDFSQLLGLDLPHYSYHLFLLSLYIES